MYEPLLDIALPDQIATSASTSGSGGDWAEKVILLPQVYVNVKGQESVHGICQTMARDAGVSLICVEGADGPVQPRDDATSIPALLTQRCAISAGVEVLLAQERQRLAVIGVDDMALEKSSQEAQTRAFATAPAREQFFQSLRPVLLRAQAQAYPPPLAAMRQRQLAVYGNWQAQAVGPQQYAQSLSMPMNDVMARLTDAAASVQVNLRAFPRLATYRDLLAIERSVDLARANQQQREFLQRVLGEVLGWAQRPDGIEPVKAMGLLRFWQAQRELSDAELEALIKTRGAMQLFTEAYQWLTPWLLEQAQAVQAGRADASEMADQIMRLALILNIPFFDLMDYRQAMTLRRRSQAMGGLAVSDEVDECCRVVAGSAPSPSAHLLMDLEERLELMYRGLRVELLPTDAEAADIQAGALRHLVQETLGLAAVGGAAGEALLAQAAGLDDALDAARIFYEHSRRRGGVMGQRTLDEMRRRGADRAVLVAGGFHQRAITRAFEADRQAAWSVVMPAVGLN